MLSVVLFVVLNAPHTIGTARSLASSKRSLMVPPARLRQRGSSEPCSEPYRPAMILWTQRTLRCCQLFVIESMKGTLTPPTKRAPTTTPMLFASAIGMKLTVDESKGRPLEATELAHKSTAASSRHTRCAGRMSRRPERVPWGQAHIPERTLGTIQLVYTS